MKFLYKLPVFCVLMALGLKLSNNGLVSSSILCNAISCGWPSLAVSCCARNMECCVQYEFWFVCRSCKNRHWLFVLIIGFNQWFVPNWHWSWSGRIDSSPTWPINLFHSQCCLTQFNRNKCQAMDGNSISNRPTIFYHLNNQQRSCHLLH